MQITSRYLTLALAFVATAALATTSAKAETTVKVPFSFTVAGKSMPAGQYILQHDAGLDTITLRGKNSTKTFTWVVGPGAVDPTDSHAGMKFDQLGDVHVLRSIHYGSQTTNRLDNLKTPVNDSAGR
ncbi:MAG TPA: hypothetical protein VK716_13330 [Terracidiphilus sp.]|jgi:hypothetical protein|nr:hypothetical protein [Terracidiphilus sp.]